MMYKKLPVSIPLLLLIVSAWLLCSCNRLKTTESRLADLVLLATEHQFIQKRINTGPFELLSFYHGIHQAEKVDVYIEGDGFAWSRKHRLSKDPTPLESIPFKLAIQSQRPAIYLARPCQYQTPEKLRQCDSRYWSSHRYAPEVVDSMHFVLNRFQQEFAIKQFRLIGYSGGGAVVVLVAAQRHDVSAILTLAANLDHEYWTKYHTVSPLVGSLNPIDKAEDLVNLPQLHVLGSEDNIIPHAVLERYRKRSAGASKIQTWLIDNQGHHCCWQKKWPEIQYQFDRLIEP